MQTVIDRCKRDEETGCLIWQGTVNNNSGRPRAKVAENSDSVQGFVYQLTRRLSRGYTATPVVCGNKRCCEPKHLRAKYLPDIVGAASRGRKHPPGHGTSGAAAAGWTKLTDAQVIAIRTRPLDMTRDQAAAHWGVTRSCIRDIDNGRRRAHVAAPVASVFALGTGNAMQEARKAAMLERLRDFHRAVSVKNLRRQPAASADRVQQGAAA